MIKMHPKILASLPLTLALLYFITGIIIWVSTGAFYFEGDSTMHYLMARYAPQHPELFFNHWGKPFFTLFASPFAAFGSSGIIIFNLLSLSATAYLTGLCAQKLTFRFPVLATMAVTFAPFVFLIALSGLTEPFSALVLVLAVYLAINNRFVTAAIIISFLPFCRSEGLILMIGFAVYFLSQKKLLPFILLGTGHIVYSLAGFFFGKDFFWVITEIPYARITSPYGHGNWSHFLTQLTYVLGLPIYALTLTGVVIIFLKTITKKLKWNSALLLLIFLPFFLFFAFHTIAWATGSFSSMGLKRVFVTVIPLIALMVAYGAGELMSLKIHSAFKNILASVVIIYLIVFPFMPNPAALIIPCDFRPHADVILMNSVARSKIADQSDIFFCSHPQLAVTGKIDLFDANSWLPITHISEIDKIESNKKCLIVWDEWFSVIEYGVSLESLKNNPDLVFLGEYSASFCRTTGHIAVFLPRP